MFESNLDISEVDMIKSGIPLVKVYDKESVLNRDLRRYSGIIDPVSISYDYNSDRFNQTRIAVLYKAK